MTPRSRLTPFRLFVYFVCFVGTSVFSSLSLRAAEPRTLVFFGDSLTAGYGLEDPAAQAYPALIQEKITAARLPWRVVNAGLSGETTSGGARRIDWMLSQRVDGSAQALRDKDSKKWYPGDPIDVFVLALGGNDGLRGIEPGISRTSLARIMDRVREKNPSAQLVVAGMMMPATLGEDYTREFAAMYPELAKKYSATLIPFLLAGVGGDSALNQEDQIHPTARGHAVVAETVWKTLQPLLIPSTP